MISPEKCQEYLKGHDDYFESKRAEFRELRAFYLTRWWEHRSTSSNTLHTEVPRAYAMVESYIGSLYAKDPAVDVQPDLRARGNPEVAEATANQYLAHVRSQVEDATRLALIYPCSFIKLAPSPSVDPLKRVSTSALPPWQVVVDDTAASWDQQRYIGHVYQMPLEEALERYGHSETDWSPRIYRRWIDDDTVAGTRASIEQKDGEAWVRIFEVYDLLDDKQVVWSEDFVPGGFVFEGVKVEVGALPEGVGAEASNADAEVEVQHETTGIPYKTASGRPRVPIIPVYLSRDPDQPLRGYSLLHRSRDQFREVNVMRTYQGQGVRRMARQWLVRAGFLGEDAAAKVAQGNDGEMIEVDLPPGQPLEGNMMPVPNTPIPADLAAYAALVENDIKEAGMLAPFTRGEVTKSTATEQNLLASYTASELGRMARIRDAVITSMAETYNIMLSVMLATRPSRWPCRTPSGRRCSPQTTSRATSATGPPTPGRPRCRTSPSSRTSNASLPCFSSSAPRRPRC